MMKKYLIIFGFLFIATGYSSIGIASEISEEELNNQDIIGQQQVRDGYYRARVEQVSEENIRVIDQDLVSQTLVVEILTGSDKGQKVTINNGGGSDLHESQKYQQGDIVIVVKTKVGEQTQFFVQDRYRLPGIVWMMGIFFVLSIFFAGWRGFGSIVGLVVSVVILAGYLMPALLAGSSPIFVTLVASTSIICLTLFISHGFRDRTGVAFVSMTLTLILAYGFSVGFVYITQMFGVGSEETFFLDYVTGVNIDLRGILLAGIIIGMLGVLDDVSIGQAAAIDEIKKANPAMRFSQLYKSGMSVGGDHIASLVNTLALAYVGSSLPLFLLLYVNQGDVPFWVTLNSEFISQELVRTIAGSTAIILAVPITSIIAAYYFGKKQYPEHDTKDIQSHHHYH